MMIMALFEGTFSWDELHFFRFQWDVLHPDDFAIRLAPGNLNRDLSRRMDGCHGS
jgi:hypothetical protein